MDELDQQILQLECEIKKLYSTLRSKEDELRALKANKNESISDNNYNPWFSTREITRYSRQMMMSEIKLLGQASLHDTPVLIVGAGGLGCPAALYLAAAGVGEIHIVDYDEVEISNLHRQILHTENDIGMPKVQSAKEKLTRLNSDIVVYPWNVAIDKEKLLLILDESKIEVILDCTDNLPTRYLLSDCSVIKNIPLVSGSALRMEGQLTVYNYKDGPCLRCLFPNPPPPETVTSCGDGGVLGPVPGTIGVLQALEAIKIISGIGSVLSKQLLIFDGTDTKFRTFKMRGKNPTCYACRENSTISNDTINYEEFCGSPACDKVTNIDILPPEMQIDVSVLEDLSNDSRIVDVRPGLEFEMCHISESLNIPFSVIRTLPVDRISECLDLLELESSTAAGTVKNVYVICRRGNDSQRSIPYFLSFLNGALHPEVRFYSVKGGFHAYSKEVDPFFPIY